MSENIFTLNTVVHREVVDAATMESAQAVLQTVRRLGGKVFGEAHGKSVCRFHFSNKAKIANYILNHSNFSVHLVDMLQGMEWTGNYQETRTVNLRDLLLQAT
jgi:hypothetical protein